MLLKTRPNLRVYELSNKMKGFCLDVVYFYSITKAVHYFEM